MAKMKAKISKVVGLIRLRKRKMKAPAPELKDPVERMRYAHENAGKASVKKISKVSDEDPFDPVTKIRSAGY